MTTSAGPTAARLVALVVDAVAPMAQGGFWALALGWEARPADGGAVVLVPRDATSFAIVLAPGPAVPAGTTTRNRIHLDLTTSSPADQLRTVEELRARGARPVDVGQGPDETHVVLADPEGNELCVLAPGNRFLAGCPRLGAVNCDGSRALGQFYGAALGWPLVWDQDEETAIQAPDGTGPKITWSGPPLMPRPPRERLHLHLGPAPGATPADVRDHLVRLGARAVDPARCDGAIGLVDVDGNELCVVGSAAHRSR